MTIWNRIERLEAATAPRQLRPLPPHVADEPASSFLPRFLRYLYLDPEAIRDGSRWHDAVWHELERLHGPEAANLFGYDRRPTWNEMLVMPKRKRDAACMALGLLPTWPPEGEQT